MPKISIIIPCYNVEKYVFQCLKSVAEQTLKDIEIICVNDGSTDTTLDIINKFKKTDNRIIILQKNNTGYGDSVNKGISIASSKYIGIVEPDDWVEPNMYEELYNIAIKYNVDIVKSNFYMFGLGIKNYIHVKNLENNRMFNKIVKINKYKFSFRFNTNNWTGIYRKDLIMKNNVLHSTSKGASYQDVGFRFLIHVFSNTIYYLDKTFYHYRLHANSSTLNAMHVKHLCNEYNYLKTKLKEYSYYKKYLGQYCVQKYLGYIWIYKMLCDSEKPYFLQNFRSEFILMNNEKELDLSFFNPIEKKQLKTILKEGKYINYPKLNFVEKTLNFAWNIKYKGFWKEASIIIKNRFINRKL